MPLPAYRRAGNIIRTVQSTLGDSLAVTTTDADGDPLALSVPVYHEDPWADPDAARSPSDAPAQQWVSTTWLEEGAGRRGLSLWQVDVYSRIGAHAAALGDPFGTIARDIADEVESAYAGARPDGRLRAWIPVFDYADPLAPVVAAPRSDVFIQTTAGAWGVPSSRRSLPVSGGFRRIVLQFSMRLKHDAVVNGWYAEA